MPGICHLKQIIRVGISVTYFCCLLATVIPWVGKTLCVQQDSLYDDFGSYKGKVVPVLN
jgi:hypothetical protein